MITVALTNLIDCHWVDCDNTKRGISTSETYHSDWWQTGDTLARNWWQSSDKLVRTYHVLWQTGDWLKTQWWHIDDRLMTDCWQLDCNDLCIPTIETDDLIIWKVIMTTLSEELKLHSYMMNENGMWLSDESKWQMIWQIKMTYFQQPQIKMYFHCFDPFNTDQNHFC